MRKTMTAISFLLPVLLLAASPVARAQVKPEERKSQPDGRALSEGERKKAVDEGLKAARAHVSAGRFADAVASFRQVLALEPGHSEALAELNLLPRSSPSPPASGAPSRGPRGGSGGGGTEGLPKFY